MCTQDEETETKLVPEEAKPDWRRLRKYLKWACIGLPVVVVVFLVAWIVFQVGVGIWADRQFQRRGPAVYTEWKAFLHTPVEFPPGLIEPAKTSEALYRRIDRVRAEFEKVAGGDSGALNSHLRAVNAAFLSNSPSMPESLWEDARGITEKCDPCILALQGLARQIEEEFRQFARPRLSHYDADLDMYRSILLLAVKSRMLTRDGDLSGSVKQGLAAFWLLAAISTRDDGYWTSLGWRESVEFSMRSEIAGVQDPQILKQTLAVLNRLDPYLNRDLVDDVWAMEVSSLFTRLLRMRRTQGETLDILPGKTGAEYVKDLVPIDRPPLGFRKSVENFTKDLMAGYRIHDRRFKSIYLEMVRALEVGDTVEQLYFFDRVRFPRSWMGVTEKRLATDMDDLRLAIASRLYKMETDTYPSATTDLVPQYLPEEVVDRETGESYTWDESGKWSAP